VPALNLAVCWKLCYNYYNTQSAGNLLSLHKIGVFRGYTPEFICRKIFSKKSCFISYVTIRRYAMKKTNESKVLESSKYNTRFSQYITGLIEGDGTIHVPKTLRSTKGKLNYPSIQIVFHLKDLPLALLIQKELGHGSLSKRKGAKAYVFTVNNLEGLNLLIHLLNGNMKTNKIEALHKLID
jgi:hypothetical protein